MGGVIESPQVAECRFSPQMTCLDSPSSWSASPNFWGAPSNPGAFLSLSQIFEVYTPFLVPTGPPTGTLHSLGKPPEGAQTFFLHMPGPPILRPQEVGGPEGLW